MNLFLNIKIGFKFQFFIVILLLISKPIYTYGQWSESQNPFAYIGQANLQSVDSGMAMNRLNYPCNLALDLVHHKLYVADQKNNRILRYSYPIASNQPQAEISIQINCYGLALDKNGTLWATTIKSIAAFDKAWLATDNASPKFKLTGMFSDSPMAITFDGMGNLWTGVNCSVWCFAPAQQKSGGKVSCSFVVQNAINIAGFAFVKNSMYVADISAQMIKRFDDPLLKKGSVVEDGKLSCCVGAYALTADSLGNLYVAAHQNTIAIYMDVRSNTKDDWPSFWLDGKSKTLGCHGICFDPDRKVLITADTHINRISLYGALPLTYIVDYRAVSMRSNSAEENSEVRINVEFSGFIPENYTPKIELKLDSGSTVVMPKSELIRIDPFHYFLLWKSGSGLGRLKPFVTDAVDYLDGKLVDEGSKQTLLNIVKHDTTLEPFRIHFDDLAPRCLKDSVFTLEATGGASSMPVCFSSSDTSMASCSGENGKIVHIHKIGFCSIFANQAGDSINSFSFQEERLLKVNACDEGREIQAHHIVFEWDPSNDLRLAWQRGNGEACAVFIKETDAGLPSPLDGTRYDPDPTFGKGNQIGSSAWYCVYVGTDNKINVSGLDPSRTYAVMVCEYKGATGGEHYQTSIAADNPRSTTARLHPFVYTFFTPNNDGRNDTWMIEHPELLANSDICVFTHSQQKVYESHGYAEPWDGKYQGRALPSGEYYYSITGEYQFKGILLIINY